MILLFLMIPYKVSSKSMEIVDRNLNVFKEGIEVYSEDLYITAKHAFQTDTSIVLRDSVFVKGKDFLLVADCLGYKIPYEILFGSGNIKIWRQDTLKGDSLVFFRESEKGKLFGNLIYMSDSIKVKGKAADFCKDSVVVIGDPEFETPRVKVKADYTVYKTKDSTFKFLSNVNFESSKIFGNSDKLIHKTKDEISTLIGKPLISEKRDSITGDMIVVNHKAKILKALNGKIITYTESGRNIVWGDTVKVFYDEESIDSVSVKGKSKGCFYKNETNSGKSG
jgi:lipopolysaccharide export system protein LptA